MNTLSATFLSLLFTLCGAMSSATSATYAASPDGGYSFDGSPSSEIGLHDTLPDMMALKREMELTIRTLEALQGADFDDATEAYYSGFFSFMESWAGSPEDLSDSSPERVQSLRLFVIQNRDYLSETWALLRLRLLEDTTSFQLWNTLASLGGDEEVSIPERFIEQEELVDEAPSWDDLALEMLVSENVSFS